MEALDPSQIKMAGAAECLEAPFDYKESQLSVRSGNVSCSESVLPGAFPPWQGHRSRTPSA